MKKLYSAFLGLIITGLSLHAFLPENEIEQMIVSYHNRAFGVDHLFDQPIPEDHLKAWLETSAAVKEYVLAHCEDIFGTQDSTLLDSLKTIEKANRSLVDAIVTTYAIKDSTKNLIKMAAVFKVIEIKMASVLKKLENTDFILRRKRNAQQLLIFLTNFIEITAKKANKDTRMGHRTDIQLPTGIATTMPKQTYIPLRPPVDLPPAYQETYTEEPTTTPPNRPLPPIPGTTAAPKRTYIPLRPPADMPPVYQETYEEEPTETPPTRPAPPIPTV